MSPLKNILLLSAIVALSACLPTKIKDSQDANNYIIQNPFTAARSGSTEVIGAPGPGSTKVVRSEKRCEGAAGSILPPLAFEEGIKGSIQTLFTPLTAAAEAVSTEKSAYDRSIFLDGIEKHFVQQRNEVTCWAAAMQTLRAYLNLKKLNQMEIVKFIEPDCPALKSQEKGATTFQVLYAAAKLQDKYDKEKVNTGLCQDSMCLIQAITNKRPVLMFKSNHVFLLVGIDYVHLPADDVNARIANALVPKVRMNGKTLERPNRESILTQRFYFLDPAKSGPEHVVMKPLDLSTADAFVVF